MATRKKTAREKLRDVHLLVMLFSLIFTACQSGLVETNLPVDTQVATDTPVGSIIAVENVPTAEAPVELVVTAVPTMTPAPPAVPIAGIEINQSSDLGLIGELGTSWVRRNALKWSLIEPTQGERNWNEAANLEQELIQISEMGMEAILIVRSTPVWAQAIPGKECGPITDEALAAYVDFLREAVSRYSQEPYNIKYWELGNEPDVDPSLVDGSSLYGCWGDLNDPLYYGGGRYAEMLKVAYPAIKSVDPEAQVLVGGLLMDCDPVHPPETAPGSGQFRYCTPSRYLEGILEEGGGDYFDGVSFHAYDYYNGSEGQFNNANWYSAWNTTGPVLEAKVNYIRSMLAYYGYHEKFLINSENALLCGRDGEEPECKTETYDLTKAYYIVQSTAMALAQDLKVNVWYSVSGWRGSGFFDRDRQPLAVYRAYQFLNQMMDGAASWGKINLSTGISGYEFRQGEKVIWLLWSLDGSPHALRLPGNPTSVYDLFGNTLPEVYNLNITLAPIYIEWVSGQ